MGSKEGKLGSQSSSLPTVRQENKVARKKPEIAVGPDLTRVVEAWPSLPESMRKAILKLIG
jgi:hypothetical protein